MQLGNVWDVLTWWPNSTFIALSGDEILAVNGTPLQGLSHAEAIAVFKSIRNGQVVIHAARRDTANKRWAIVYSSHSCGCAKKFKKLKLTWLFLNRDLFFFLLIIIFVFSKSKSCDDLDRVECWCPMTVLTPTSSSSSLLVGARLVL